MLLQGRKVQLEMMDLLDLRVGLGPWVYLQILEQLVPQDLDRLVGLGILDLLDLLDIQDIQDIQGLQG